MNDLPLGRLLCVGVRGTRAGDPLLEADLEVCARAGVGGVILFDVDVPTWRAALSRGVDEAEARRHAVRNVEDPEQLAALVATLRRRLGPGLFVAIDQEGGRVARLGPERGFRPTVSARDFATLEPEARERIAQEQASQLAALGIDFDFAPCVDLALEPANEILVRNGRCFSDDPGVVIECADLQLRALSAAGVASCLKHFPGHGSSRGDTHLGLVDISGSWCPEKELLPYRALLGRPGVSVMVSHLVHRDWDGETPASLNPRVMQTLLRDDLGFDGLVVTDSIDMGAIYDRIGAEEAVVRAVQAGADWVVDAFNRADREEHPALGLVAALRRALDDGRLPGGVPRIERSLARLRRLRTELHPR